MGALSTHDPFSARYRIPQDLAPYKDELGEWHPPRLSGRYKARAWSPWIDELGRNLEFINKQIEKTYVEDLGFSSNKSVNIEDLGFLMD